ILIQLLRSIFVVAAGQYQQSAPIGAEGRSYRLTEREILASSDTRVEQSQNRVRRGIRRDHQSIRKTDWIARLARQWAENTHGSQNKSQQVSVSHRSAIVIPRSFHFYESFVAFLLIEVFAR